MNIKPNETLILKLQDVMKEHPDLVGVVVVYDPGNEVLSCADNVGKLQRIQILSEAIKQTATILVEKQ